MAPAVITREIASNVLKVVDAGLTSGVGKPIPGQMCVEAAVCYALGLPHGGDPRCVALTLRALNIRLNDANWSSNKARAKGLRRLAIAQLGSARHLDEQEFRRRVVDYALRRSTPAAVRAAASILKNAEHKAAFLNAATKCEREGTREAAIEATKITAAAVAAPNAAYAAAACMRAADAADAAAEAAATILGPASFSRSAAAADYAAYAAAYAATAAIDTDAAYAAVEAVRKSARDKSLAAYAEDIVQILIELKAPGCRWLDLAEIAP